MTARAAGADETQQGLEIRGSLEVTGEMLREIANDLSGLEQCLKNEARVQS